MAPDIPVNPDDLPTSFAVMDTTLVYEGFIHDAGLEKDKNDNIYLWHEVEIYLPDEWAGKRVRDNYIRIPPSVTPTMRAGERRAAEDAGVRYARFCKAFNPPRPINTESMKGAKGKFTINNEEYPEGSGEMRPRIANYVF